MPTVEELWRRFGDGIERTARTTIEAHCNALDRPAIPYAIEDAVRAASVQIMMEFADRLQAHPDFADQPAITYWLKRRARIVSQDLVESGDVTPGAASTPMPQAVPASVRIYFRIRALSAAQRARGAELLRQGGQLSGWFAGGALAFGRRLRQIRNDGIDLARHASQRVSASVTAIGTTAAQNVPAALGTVGGLPEAAVAAAAAVALAFGGQGHPAHVTRARPPEIATAPAGMWSRAPLPTDLPLPAAPPLEREPPSAEPSPEGDAPPVPSPMPTPAVPSFNEPQAGRPSVVASPTGPGSDRRLVRETQGDDSTEHHTPDNGRIELDADGDGDHEASIGLPYVFIECADEDDQSSIVLGTTCPITGSQRTDSYYW